MGLFELTYLAFWRIRRLISYVVVLFYQFGYDICNHAYTVLADESMQDQAAAKFAFLNYGYHPGACAANAKIDECVTREKAKLKNELPEIFATVWGSVQLYAAVLSRFEDPKVREVAKQHTTNETKTTLNSADILEVGCGRGGGCAVAHALFSPSVYLGVDLSRTGVEACRAFFRDVKKPSSAPQFVVGNSMALHDVVSPASYDAVVNVESAHCYPVFESFIKGVAFALRPGGVFLFADVCPAEAWQDIRDSLARHNLVIAVEHDITANAMKSLEEEIEPALHKMNMSAGKGTIKKALMWIVSRQTVRAPKNLMERGVVQYRLLAAVKTK